MTLFDDRFAFPLLFLMTISAAPAYSAEKELTAKDKSNPDVSFTSRDIEIGFPKALLDFMLENPALSCRLANELGLTEARVEKRDKGPAFADNYFTLHLREIVKEKSGAIKLGFLYEIGIDEPYPIKTTGNGTALLAAAEKGEGALAAEITVKLFANGSYIDDAVKKFPLLLEMVFNMKVEKALEEAGKLAEYFMEEPETLLEIANDEESEFSVSELRRLKEYLDGGR